jgi:endoglucanase
MPHRRRRLSRWGVAGIIAAAVVVVVAAAVFAVPWAVSTLQRLGAEPPVRGGAFLVPSGSKAVEAAKDAPAGSAAERAASYLGDQPTAVWLTPEAFPSSTVGTTVAGLAAEARDQHAALVIVVYGIPDRDCQGHSAGGAADDSAYDTWVGRIGTALRGSADVATDVILEPDSLALAPQCHDADQRVSELKQAVARLSATNTWIYLDGGHSNWLPVSQMAALIGRVGIGGSVRGFATNVSNFNATDREVAYAHAVASGLSGAHAVIDTSRNGAGALGSEWCNPPGRLVGERAGAVGDDVVDTNLWVKPPGESDGECNGGPAAGAWWPQAAIELTRDAVK